MTQTHDAEAIPTHADKIELHRDLSMLHAKQAQDALHDLQHRSETSERNPVLNQVIGVNLKLADVHARLAVAVSQSATVGAVITVAFAQEVAKSLRALDRAMGGRS